jgi:hypothetical protein
VFGEVWDGDNPRLTIPVAWHEFVSLWFTCRGEAGIAHWPDPGGVADQSAWLLDAFAALGGMLARYQEDKRREKSG